MALVGLLAAVLAVAGCSSSSSEGTGPTTITVAVVNNPQMQNMQQLLPDFQKANPDVKVNLVLLEESTLRNQIDQDLATKSGKYDVVYIGPFDTPLYAKKGWLEDLTPYINKTSSYDAADLIPGVAKALQYNNDQYAVPFYGESSMLMYRKDMLSAKGITLADHPTWDEVATAAKAVNDPGKGVAGICLRGKPGWGESMAAIDTVVNAYGGKWYDQQWHAHLTDQPFKDAVSFYTDLLKSAGESSPTSTSFNECLAQYNQGKVAMWYDATVGASNFTGAAAQNSGYAYAPKKAKDWNGWLWTWALGIEANSSKKDAAWKYTSWATSKDYINAAGAKFGWSSVPPGTRTSTYNNPSYKAVASSFADVTLNSMAHADTQHPTVDPVPYVGIQYVDIDGFQDVGTEVSQNIGGVISGTSSVDDALNKSQPVAEALGAKQRK